MNDHRLKYSVLPGRFVVCRLEADAHVPEWALKIGNFNSVSRTADELSIVCREENAPHEIKTEPGWLCLKLNGPFPFSQTGILASFISPLSKRGIPIFAVSTFDTDYVLIKEEFLEVAILALREAGHEALPETL